MRRSDGVAASGRCRNPEHRRWCPQPTVVPFLQPAAPAVSFTIHANAITNTPRCTATGQHRFIGQLSPPFSNREVLGGCLGEPYAGRDISRRKFLYFQSTINFFWRIDILTINAPLDSKGMFAEHLATANREFTRAAIPSIVARRKIKRSRIGSTFSARRISAPESTFFFARRRTPIPTSPTWD